MSHLFWILFLGASSWSDTPLHPKCLSGSDSITKQVTHYMVPLLSSYNHKVCNQIEGTCIYKKNGVQWLHNFGYEDQKLTQARCKNGYGNKKNCLNPCRTVAASMDHHRYGQIMFIKDLVGKRCGNRARDGFEMIHDGLVVVADTGSPRYFNAEGRFDFFWGRCSNRRSGICLEGAQAISQETSNSSYCTIWDPDRPTENQDVKLDFDAMVKEEALARGDTGAAAEL